MQEEAWWMDEAEKQKSGKCGCIPCEVIRAMSIFHSRRMELKGFPRFTPLGFHALLRTRVQLMLTKYSYRLLAYKSRA